MKDTRTSSISWCDGGSHNTLSLCDNVITLKNRQLTLSYNAGEKAQALFDRLFAISTNMPKILNYAIFGTMLNLLISETNTSLFKNIFKSVEVHKEPENMGMPCERCVDCKSPTAYWMEDKHTPLCPECAIKRNTCVN